VAVISPRGTVLYANTEFERCMSEYKIFRKSANGVLQIAEERVNGTQAKHFHDLVAKRDQHGLFGARARQEGIVVNLAKPGTALFIEVCPIEVSERTGNLGQGCRLVTIIDTSRAVSFDTARLQSYYHLTISETEILELVARGWTNAEISEMRNRSLDTVKSQMKNLMRKTNSQNRTDLVHMIHNLSSVIRYQAEP
jgi:DNA-binding CsgD family transcriptional regulator